MDPFYLDQYEVTNAQYAAFVAATGHRAPYNWPQGKVPEGKERSRWSDVDWDDAAAYAKWAGKRLPTEAEWERACRGAIDKATYPWGNRKPDSGRRALQRGGRPGAGWQVQSNYFGLYDIVGNVWEWCADWYDIDYYEKAPDANPQGPEKGMYRVLRGGSWADVEKYLTCAYRSWVRPSERGPNIGFRCAKASSKVRSVKYQRILRIATLLGRC